MALRELVTGSDACTPAEGGAGPSNAMAGLADSLLGRSSKAQERLREVRLVGCLGEGKPYLACQTAACQRCHCWGRGAAGRSNASRAAAALVPLQALQCLLPAVHEL